MTISPSFSLIFLEANSIVCSRLLKKLEYPAFPGFAISSRGFDCAPAESGGRTFVAATEIEVLVGRSSPEESTAKASAILVDRIRVDE